MSVPPSIAQANVAPDVVEWNPNVAVVLLVIAAGPLSITVLGGGLAAATGWRLVPSRRAPATHGLTHFRPGSLIRRPPIRCAIKRSPPPGSADHEHRYQFRSPSCRARRNAAGGRAESMTMPTAPIGPTAKRGRMKCGLIRDRRKVPARTCIGQYFGVIRTVMSLRPRTDGSRRLAWERSPRPDVPSVARSA